MPNLHMLGIGLALLMSHASAGTLVVIGGALASGNAPIFEEIVGAALEGPICVLGTASSDLEESVASTIEDFGAHSAAALPVPNHRR